MTSIPTDMKAAFLVRTGAANKAFEIRKTLVPQVNGSKLLIKVEAFGLNFADVMSRQGLYRDAPKRPFIPGYDICGRVAAAGPEAPKELVGKRVVALTRFGGYAEYAVAETLACAEMPENYPAAEACALATQYCTALYAAEHCVNLRPGDNVLFHAAAGGVGIALGQLAELKGCKAYGVVSSVDKAAWLQARTKVIPIINKNGAYFSQIKLDLGGNFIDAAFNSVGGSTFKKDLSLLRPGGRSVLYGAAERSGQKGGFLATLNLVLQFGFFTPISLMMQSKAIAGVNLLRIADHKPLLLKKLFDDVVHLAQEKKIHPHSAGLFTLNQLAEAHAALENRKTIGKVAVVFDAE
ncbi:MAG: alcohol dehydrogenase catalytic domain-containing protein [Flavobacteriales bacterium]